MFIFIKPLIVHSLKLVNHVPPSYWRIQEAPSNDLKLVLWFINPGKPWKFLTSLDAFVVCGSNYQMLANYTSIV